MTGFRKFAAAAAVAFCFVACGAGRVHAQDYPGIAAEARPREATVGVPLKYTVTISGRDLRGIGIALPDRKEYFPEKAPAMPASPADSVPLYIINSAKKESVDGRNQRRITVTLELAFYRPGKHPLPEIDIRDRENVKIGYRVPEVEIKPANEKGEFQEIEPPLSLRGNYYRLLALAGGIAVAAAAGFFVYSYLKKRNKTETPAPGTVRALDVFLGETGELRREGLIDRGRAREFAFRLSEAFRRFVSAQLGADAMEMTSSELAAFLERGLPRTVFAGAEKELRELLSLWDLAKFASFAPTAETLRSNLESAVRLARIFSREGSRVRS
jgi:hypothetical protein